MNSLYVITEALRLYKTPSKLNLAKTSNSATNLAIFTLAQPILELVWGPLFTLTCLAGPSTALPNCRLVARSCTCSPVAPVESLAARPDTPTTSPTSTGSDTLRLSSSRRWLTVWTSFGTKTQSSSKLNQKAFQQTGGMVMNTMNNTSTSWGISDTGFICR